MDLSTGQTQLLTPLLSADYPDNFRKAADILTKQGITLVEGEDKSAVLREAFISWIENLAWSPDGRYLAFAGQMDGLSSDLYVYDTRSRKIERLSDGFEQIHSITWSPDGKWIVHSSANMIGMGIEYKFHAAALDGSAMKSLPSSVTDIRGWLTPSIYLYSDAANGRGHYNLRSFDLQSGSIQTFWPGTFEDFDFDHEKNLFVVSGDKVVWGKEDMLQKENVGLFVVSLADGSIQKISDTIFYRVKFMGVEDRRFIVWQIWPEESFYVTSDGAMVKTNFGKNQIWISPDMQYVATISKTLKFFTIVGKLIREIQLTHPPKEEDKVIWRPDSSGLFFLSDTKLYAADLLSGEVYLVDDGVPHKYDFEYTWASGQ